MKSSPPLKSTLSKIALAFTTLVLCSTCLAYAADAGFEKGVSLYKAGRYQEAITNFRSAADRGVSKPTSIYYMAMCFQQLGKLKEAHDSYKFVCTTYPNAPVADKCFEMMKQIGDRMQNNDSPRPEEKPVTLPVGNILQKKGIMPPLSAGTYVLRYTEEAMDGRMYLDAIINKKPCKVLFDTGAGVTFCRQSFLDKQRWHLDWIKENAIIPGALKESPAKVAVVQITLGTFTRDDKIYVEQDSPDSLYASYDNCPIIGQSFFGDLQYEIDGKNKRITFHPPGKLRTKKDPPIKLTAKEVPFTRDGSHIVVKAKVNNRECEMYLDTGASQVVFADRHLAACGLNRPVDATQTVRRTGEGRRESYAFTIDSITLGPIEKTEVNAALLPNTKFSRPLLGQSFFEGLRYTVDPSRNVIRFD